MNSGNVTRRMKVSLAVLAVLWLCCAALVVMGCGRWKHSVRSSIPKSSDPYIRCENWVGDGWMYHDCLPPPASDWNGPFVRPTPIPTPSAWATPDMQGGWMQQPAQPLDAECDKVIVCNQACVVECAPPLVSEPMPPERPPL